jgi:hypothetical protein
VIPVPPLLFPAKKRIIKTIARAIVRRTLTGRCAFMANSGLKVLMSTPIEAGIMVIAKI